MRFKTHILCCSLIFLAPLAAEVSKHPRPCTPMDPQFCDRMFFFFNENPQFSEGMQVQKRALSDRTDRTLAHCPQPRKSVGKWDFQQFKGSQSYWSSSLGYECSQDADSLIALSLLLEKKQEKSAPAPIFTGVEKILIPSITFLKDPLPMLSGLQTGDFSDISFIEDPPRLLADIERIEVPEIAFLKDRNSDQEEIQIHMATSEKPFVQTGDQLLIAVGEDFDLEGEETTKEPEKEEEEVIFISQVQAKGNELSYNDEPLIRRSAHSSKELAVDQALPAVQAAENDMVYCPPKDPQEAGFHIRKKKITNKEYLAFVQEIGYEPPPHWMSGSIPPGEEDQPVVNVSYKDALLYAVWAGQRLASEDEIRRAGQIEGLLTDTGDNLNEWTSTPYVEKNSFDATVGAKVGGKGSLEHKIFGQSNPRPMANGEFNVQTGFRTAS